MLDLIRAAPLISLLVTLIGSAVVSAPAGWMARSVIYDWFEKPALVQHQLEQCAATTEAAAARATQQAQDKYFQMGESLWREEVRKAADDAAEHDAQLRLIHEEAMDYVGQRESAGAKACRPDDLDRAYIERVWGGVRPAPVGHSGGGS